MPTKALTGDDPWMVPVPVVPSGFTALHRRHRGCNVEVDLGLVGSFGSSAAGDLLQADLQTNLDINSVRRLGSGRAGFYGGKYLKGIGRTQLAANFRARGDAYHASGHLLPSAALREYLVSVYLRARGLDRHINPCEGLLLKRLGRGTEGYVHTMLRGLARRGTAPIAPIDLRLQALTVKAGGFARLSNFVWALHHHRPRARFLGDLFCRMQRFLSPRGGAVLAPAGCTAESLVASLSESVSAALESFAGFFSAGVYWGSFHNNFTADGRFLDLEVPTVVGRPLLYVPCNDGRRRRSIALNEEAHLLVGLEVFHYVRQMRLFVRYLKDQLAFLLGQGLLRRPIERDFLGQVLAELRAVFHRRHLLLDEAALRRWVVATIGAALALPAAERRGLERLVRAQHALYFHDRRPEAGHLAVRPLEMGLIDPEPGARVTAHVPVMFDTGAAPGADPAAEAFNEAVLRLEQLTDVDEVLAGVGEAERRINACARGGISRRGS